MSDLGVRIPDLGGPFRRFCARNLVLGVRISEGLESLGIGRERLRDSSRVANYSLPRTSKRAPGFEVWRVWEGPRIPDFARNRQK